MTRYQVHDRIGVPARIAIVDGFLVARDCAMARTGIQQYHAYELGMDKSSGMDPMRMMTLFRPDDEVFNLDSLKTFENAPVTLDHPPELVTPANWSTYAKGEARDVRRDGDFMRGTLIIKAADAIQAIESGQSQLSNGYLFDLDMTPGTTPAGEAYDGIQRNIRGNHVAIVQSARCGSACRIGDSPLTQGADAMTDVLRKLTVLGIPIEVNDTAAAVIDKLQTNITTLTAEKEAAVKQLGTSITLKIGDAARAYAADEVVALLAAKDKEIGVLKAQVLTPEGRDALVADFAAMMVTAKRLMPSITTDGKHCVAIRREVLAHVAAQDEKGKAIIEAVLAGKDIASADDAAIRAAYKAIDAAMPSASDANQAQDTTGQDLATALAGTGAKKDEPKLIGRDAMLARQSKAWQGATK